MSAALQNPLTLAGRLLLAAHGAGAWSLDAMRQR